MGETHYVGQITLDQVSGTHDLHLPVAFTRGQGSVTLTTDCTPTTITLAPRTESICKVTAVNVQTRRPRSTSRPTSTKR